MYRYTLIVHKRFTLTVDVLQGGCVFGTLLAFSPKTQPPCKTSTPTAIEPKLKMSLTCCRILNKVVISLKAGRKISNRGDNTDNTHYIQSAIGV